MKQSEYFKFQELLHQFANIRRTVRIKGHSDFENDAEHSFILAMTVWYLMDKFKLNLDPEKVFSYALCHDLVEVYAGDTDPLIDDEEKKNSKSLREHEALEKISRDFPGFINLCKTIGDYEKRQDQESKFVYLIDKILPETNIIVSGDDYGARQKLTFEKWEEWFEERRVKADFQNETVNKFLDEFKSFLKQSEGMFHRE